MKVQLKKALSGFLVLILTLGMVNWGSITTKALDLPPEHAGKNLTTVTPAFQESNGAAGFYVTTTDDPLAYAGNWSIRYGNVIEGGVYVNGGLTDVAMIKIAPGRYYVALSDSGIGGTKGMTVVIDGTYYDDQNVVTFKRTAYSYDGSTWKADDTGKNKATVTPKFQESGGANGFYITTENDPLAYAGDWSVRYGSGSVKEGGVYVNGGLTDVAMIKIAAGRYYVALSDSGISGTNGMKVEIEGVYFDDDNLVTFKKTAYSFDGTAWKADGVEKNKTTVTPAYGWSGGATGFYITTTDDPLAYAENWSIRYGNVMEGGVYVDGNLTDVVLIKIAAGTYYVALGDSGISGTNGMTVVIDGTYFDDANVVTFKKTMFVYDGTSWKLDMSEELESKNKVTTSIYKDSSNGVNGFYFKTDGDPLAYSTDWSVRYSAPNTVRGGIYLDGELTDIYLMKIAPGRYYVPLSDFGIAGTNGMKVVIDATYFDDEDVVTFRKATFVCDGTEWNLDMSEELAKKNKVTTSIYKDSSNGVNGFYFRSDGDPLAYNTDWSLTYGVSQSVKGGVYLDGKLTDIHLMKIAPGRYYVPLSDWGIAGTDGMTVVIDATYFDDEDVVTFRKATFVCDGTEWNLDLSEELAKKNKVTATIRKDSGNGNRGFYFTTDNDPLAYNTDWSVTYGVSQSVRGGVYLDGKLTDIHLMKIAPGRYYVPLSDWGIVGTDGMTAVIDAIYFDDNNVVTFPKTTFIYDGIAWEMDMSEKVANKNKVTVSLSEDRAGSMTSGSRGFYFYTKSDAEDGVDPLAYSTNWDVRYGSTEAAKGGVYIDGELTIVYIIKMEPSRYYVALSDFGISSTKGMEVVIRGSYFDDKNLVTFKSTKFVFDGRCWRMEGADENNNLDGLVEAGEITAIDIYDFTKTYSMPVFRQGCTAFGSLKEYKNVSLKMKVNVNEDAFELLFGMGKASPNNMWLGDGYQFWVSPASGMAIIKTGVDDAVAYGYFDPSGEFTLEFGAVDVNTKEGEYYGVKTFIKINGEEVAAYAETIADRIQGKNFLYYVPAGVTATLSTAYELKELPVTYVVDGTETEDCELVEVPGVIQGKPFYYTIRKNSGEKAGVKNIQLMLNGTEVKVVGRNSNSYTFSLPAINDTDTLKVVVQTAELVTDEPVTIFDIFDVTGASKSKNAILGSLCDGEEYHANEAVRFQMNLPETYTDSGFALAARGSTIWRTSGYTFWFSNNGVKLCYGANGEQLSFAASNLFKGGSSVYIECGIVKCYENGVYKYDRIYIKAGTAMEDMKLLTWYDSTNRGGYGSGMLSNGIAEYCTTKSVCTLTDNSAQNEKEKISKVYYPAAIVYGEAAKIMLYPENGMKVTDFRVGNKQVEPFVTEDGAYVYAIDQVTGDIGFSYRTAKE